MDKSKTILILCAMKTEAKPFVEALTEATVSKKGSLQIYEGLLDNTKVVLAFNAIGVKKAAAATRFLLKKFDVACLVMSGTAGAIASRLEIGDTVVATETVFHDRNDDTVFPASEDLLGRCREALLKHPVAQPIHFGRVATGKDFVRKSQRAAIISDYNPLCVEMESAAVAQICGEQGVPFLAIRSISDTEAKSGLLSFWRHAKQASESSFLVTRALLNSAAFLDKI